MNWRNFKKQLEGEKVEKVEKPLPPAPFSTLTTFSTGKADLKIAAPPSHTSRNLCRPTTYQQRLAAEAEARVDFCATHSRLLGGCRHFHIIEGHEPGDQAAALDSCLLWALVRAGRKVELAAAAEVLPGLTVGDVMIFAGPDHDMLRADRRLFLTAAASLAGTVLGGHTWTTNPK
jgi:hypothetical protein